MKTKILINLPTYQKSGDSQSDYAHIIMDALKDSFQISTTCSEDCSDKLISSISVNRMKLSKNIFLKIYNFIIFNLKIFMYLYKNKDTYVINFTESIFPFFYKRQIVMLHDLIQIYYPRNMLSYLFYKYYLTYVCRRVKLNITCSKTSQLDLLSYNISSEVIYRMYDPDSLKNRNINKCSQKEYTGIYVGTLANHKNFEYFEEIVRLMSTHNFVAVLPERDILKVKPQKNLKIFHSLSKVNYENLISKCNFFISPSHIEGFGPVFDGMLCGIKTMVSDIPVYTEIYSDVSIFFNKDDPNSCVNLILDNINSEFNSVAADELKKMISAQNLKFKNLIIKSTSV